MRTEATEDMVAWWAFNKAKQWVLYSLHQPLLVCPLLYFLLLLLSVNLLSPEEDESSKARLCVRYCFPVVHHVGEYIFLDLFHQDKAFVES